MSLGFGFEYRGLPPAPVITVIEPDGPAQQAGLRVGDVIGTLLACGGNLPTAFT